MTRLTRRPALRVALGMGTALAAGLILPVVVHLVPVEAGPPMGARLLPIFLAATVAAMWMGPVSALSIAVATPLLNRLLTGSPAGPMLPTVLIELTLVVALLVTVAHRAPSWSRFAAAPAYLAAAVVAGLIVHGDGPTATLLFALRTSWPGLILLAAAGAVAAPRAARREGSRS